MNIARSTSRLVGLDLVGKVAAGSVSETLWREGLKGCDPTVWPQPVDLEPPYSSAVTVSPGSPNSPAGTSARNLPRRIKRPVFLKVWCPRELGLDWREYHDLLKELTVLRHPFAFEILGNCEGVWVQFVVDRRDLMPFRTVVEAEFPDVRLEEVNDDGVALWLNKPGASFELADFVPVPPNYRTMTVHETFGGSPLAPIYAALSRLPASQFAFYRVTAVAVDPDHDWHRHLNDLVDLDYRGSREEHHDPTIPYALHQVPSQYLPMISEREERKAHPDRLFLAVNVTTVAIARNGQQTSEILRTLQPALANFMYGAKPLHYQNKDVYLSALGSPRAVKRMLIARRVHRPGMLLNTLECCGFVHLPHRRLLEPDDTVVHHTRGLEVPEHLRSGRLLVGHNDFMGARVSVYITDRLTNEICYVIGKPGVGKSLLLENFMRQEIDQGRGVGLIDPHGDLTESVLRQIPRSRLADVVLLDFHDDAYVACLNPFAVEPHEDLGQLADEITSSFRDMIESWGPRMENILRQACYGLLHMPGSSFADVGLLLAHTPDGERFRRQMLKHVTNLDAIRFWTQSFPKYKAEALDPVTNKISKLLLNEKIAAVFSQREGKIRWRAIMDEGKIFLARLSGLGTGNTNFVGSLIIGGFKQAACSRADPANRRPFSLYVDEFHRFPTSSIEDLLVESRKFGMPLRLAHQETGQIDYPTRRAVGTADTVISFCVDTEDARHLMREFRKEIKEEDLLNLRVGEAYARIDNEIVNITTPPPPPEPTEDVVPEIIELSRRQYCVPRSAQPTRSPTKKARVFETFRNLFSRKELDDGRE